MYNTLLYKLTVVRVWGVPLVTKGRESGKVPVEEIVAPDSTEVSYRDLWREASAPDRRSPLT